MRSFLFIFLLSFPFVVNAQIATKEFCDEINQFDSITDGDINRLQVETNNFFKKAFQDMPTIVDEVENLPANWLKQGFLVGLAECYINGNQVEKNTDKAKLYLHEAKALGNDQAAHMLASLQLLRSSDNEEQKEGFVFLEQEYETGSAYSAGKLGWAYQKGLGVDPNIEKALEFYNYAAKKGMTYWQYLLAHAYQKGYFGLAIDQEKLEYWKKFKPKVHAAIYEC